MADRLYTILPGTDGQKQTLMPRSNGQMGYDWTITFVTPSGVQRSFTIPEEVYNAKNVHDIAQALAQETEGVAGLPDSLSQQQALAP